MTLVKCCANDALSPNPLSVLLKTQLPKPGIRMASSSQVRFVSISKVPGVVCSDQKLLPLNVLSYTRNSAISTSAPIAESTPFIVTLRTVIRVWDPDATPSQNCIPWELEAVPES